MNYQLAQRQQAQIASVKPVDVAKYHTVELTPEEAPKDQAVEVIPVEIPQHL